jgi:4-amino-4-deoxy-L-arabinose transferase-like glycosyltransferase
MTQRHSPTVGDNLAENACPMRVRPSRLQHPLTAILLGALVVRLVIISMTGDLGIRIADERDYHDLATSLVTGTGFTSRFGPTSLRPPLYPAFVAGAWNLTDSRSLQVVRLLQALLGLATAGLVFHLGRRLYDQPAALAASAVIAYYPALLLSHSLLLTETLFAFLLTAASLAIVVTLQQASPAVALGGGVLLGLAALTRSIVWPFPVVLAPFVVLVGRGLLRQRVACAALLLAGHVLVVAPWAIRNTQLQGMPVVVDTMGGLNLRMGNYEHTPHDRIWDAVSMAGSKSWVHGLPPAPPGGGVWNEGQKERWAREQAVAFILDHPGLTLWRSAIKFTDFWGLDRDFLAGVQRGLFNPPRWASGVAGLALLVGYPLVICLAILGVCLRPPADWRGHAALWLLVAFVTALHSVVFGHPRYRLPLTPIFAVYAGAALAGRVWQLRQQYPGRWRLAVAICAGLVAIWIAQFVVRDWPHVQRLVGSA